MLHLVSLSSPQCYSQIIIASDNAVNYGSSWATDSNQGFGLQPWVYTSHSGNGSAGNFFGNPADAGITGMIGPAFALFANPGGS